METKVTLTCTLCGRIFTRRKATHKQAMSRGRRIFCSPSCNTLDQKKQITTSCEWCNTSIIKTNSQMQESHHFCNRSCAAFYRNSHKTTGTRRSKLEIWLEEKLRIHYPSSNITFNGTNAINAELDIHFPDLNLAFELNGIFHYEPIFGPEKLATIQNNDRRKFQACLEKGIEFCVIDISSMKYFKTNKCQQFLDIITKIIDAKIQKDDCGTQIRTEVSSL